MTTLMADLVAQQQKREEPGQHTTEKAKQLLAQLLLPKQITGKLIGKYIKKAMRIGAWRKLPYQTRALLYIARNFFQFRSNAINQLLQQILINIELSTIKGKALYHGIIISLEQTLYTIKQVSDISKNIFNRMIILGISFLNNPLVYEKY